MDVEVVDMPEARTGVVRGTMASMPETQQRLHAVAGEAGLLGRPGVAHASIMPVELLRTGPGEGVRYDAALLVPADIALPDGLEEDRVPAGRYARAVHLGPYEGLGETWGRFTGEWLPSSGREIGDGVCFEIYRNSPADTQEAELRTELYIPLA